MSLSPHTIGKLYTIPNNVPLPVWQSHKVVSAFKIQHLQPIHGGTEERYALSGEKVPKESPVVVDREWYEHHHPYVGGYFVVYDDGYASFSPTEAFEKGYSRVDQNEFQSQWRDVYQRVREINIAFGNPSHHPSMFKDEAAEKLFNQSRNMIDELNETFAALIQYNQSLIEHTTLRKKDITTPAPAVALEDVRDGLCDFIVFAMGALHFMSIDHVDFGSVVGDNVVRDEKDIARLMQALGELQAFTHDIVGRCNELSNELWRNSNYLYSVKGKELYHALRDLLAYVSVGAWQLLGVLGADPQEDMYACLQSVESRFIKDEEDKQQTLEKWMNKLGVHEDSFYFEGQYPKMCIKAARDLDDAPKGKFLKSASSKKPQYARIDITNT